MNLRTILFLGLLSFTSLLNAQTLVAAADHMNCVYIGIDNPISIGCDQAVSNATTTNGTLRQIDSKHYIWNPSTPSVNCDLSLLDAKGAVIATQRFRAKRIPDPVITIGSDIGDKAFVSSGKMKAQQGIMCTFPNCDMDLDVEIVGFKLIYVGKRNDYMSIVNKGAKFGSEAMKLINLATPGDIYYIEDIKVNTPGDDAARDIGFITVKIR